MGKYTNFQNLFYILGVVLVVVVIVEVVVVLAILVVTAVVVSGTLLNSKNRIMW